jgi:hypothetical protein
MCTLIEATSGPCALYFDLQNARAVAVGLVSCGLDLLVDATGIVAWRRGVVDLVIARCDLGAYEAETDGLAQMEELVRDRVDVGSSRRLEQTCSDRLLERVHTAAVAHVQHTQDRVGAHVTARMIDEDVATSRVGRMQRVEGGGVSGIGAHDQPELVSLAQSVRLARGRVVILERGAVEYASAHGLAHRHEAVGERVTHQFDVQCANLYVRWQR